MAEADVIPMTRHWRGELHRNVVRFERDVRRAEKRFRQSIPRFLRQASPRNLATAPAVYSLIVPLVILDVWVTVYQWLSFPLYGIPWVRRRDYFIVDRHKLGYLNAIEKLHCLYCSYANGLFAYAREIAARTEQYWCPIKHARRVRDPHGWYRHFAEYGDAPGYRRELPRLREHVQKPLLHVISDRT